nr:unnamed protein product [Spirometra erinaceieuropaei]
MDDLRDWQSLILQFESLLTWEKPALLLKVIFLITVFYGSVWFFEPPLLTSIGFLIVVVNLTDYFGRLLSSRFRSNVSSAEQYRKYLEFCKRLINFRVLVISTFEYIAYLRNRRPFIYTIVCLNVLPVLLVVAYRFDGILLAYFLTIFFLLVPGVRHTGLLTIISFMIRRILRFLLHLVSRCGRMIIKLVSRLRKRSLADATRT